jgi:uncharacterized protein (DUF983 family)
VKTAPLTRSNSCPRCKSGFLVFGSMDGEGSCLNCGHHVETDLPSTAPSLFTIDGPTRPLSTETLLAEGLPSAPQRVRRHFNRAGLDL